jgi:pyridoxal phosphate enzyme (YggS family)
MAFDPHEEESFAKSQVDGLGGEFNASHPLPSGEGRVRDSHFSVLFGRPSPAAPAALIAEQSLGLPPSPEGRGEDALLVEDGVMQRSPEGEGVMAERWARLTQELADARRGTPYASQPPVTLIAVSKTASLPAMVEAYYAGCRHFGENRVQVALAKQAEWPPELTGIHWHLIGPLQRNKVTKAVGAFSLIHSVEDVALAEAINRVAQQRGIVQPILLQLNASAEAQKHGWPLTTTRQELQPLLSLQNIKLMGCMAMAAEGASPDQLHTTFAQVRHWRDEILKKDFPQALELSMGMSDDSATAIAEGATMVRLGRAVFAP